MGLLRWMRGAGTSKTDKYTDVTAAYTPVIEGVYQDLTAPLSHYFISSSHNSYLLGNQLTSECGTAEFIKALRMGCRVVEFDVYNADPDRPEVGPMVKHGNTLTKAVPFEECVKAVGQHAFDASPYPVIITMEDHCDAPNQRVMVDILRRCLSGKLYEPLGRARSFESPETLRGRILIRDKPNHDKPDAMAEELRRLVYVDNSKFVSFEQAKASEYVVSNSFDEGKLETLQTQATEVLEYSSRHLMRVYPAGTRVLSGNYDPTAAWALGAQVVALNWQDNGKEVWINTAKFDDNGKCGYVKKPQWMLQSPYEPPQGIKRVLCVRVFTVQSHTAALKFECLRGDDLYVTLQVLGWPGDQAKGHTKTAFNTSRYTFDQEFRFPLQAPELDVLMVTLKDQDYGNRNDTKGHFGLPLNNLREGRFRLPMLHPDGTEKKLGSRWVSVSLQWTTDTTNAGENTTSQPMTDPTLGAQGDSKSVASPRN